MISSDADRIRAAIAAQERLRLALGSSTVDLAVAPEPAARPALRGAARRGTRPSAPRGVPAGPRAHGRRARRAPLRRRALSPRPCARHLQRAGSRGRPCRAVRPGSASPRGADRDGPAGPTRQVAAPPPGTAACSPALLPEVDHRDPADTGERPRAAIRRTAWGENPGQPRACGARPSPSEGKAASVRPGRPRPWGYGRTPAAPARGAGQGPARSRPPGSRSPLEQRAHPEEPAAWKLLILRAASVSPPNG